MSTKLPIGYSEEDFKLLSPEERAGMLELAQQEQIELGLAEEEDATGDGSAPVVAQATEQPPAAAQQPPGTTPAPTTTPAPAAELPPQDAQQRLALAQMLGNDTPPPLLPEWKAPPDVDQRMTAAEQRKLDLAQRFEDGDLTSKEFLAQTSAIDREIRDLDWLKRQAQMSADVTENNFSNIAVPKFLTVHTEYADPDRLAILDLFVRQEQTAAMAAGGSQYDPRLLEKAHARVTAKFGGGTQAAPSIEKRPDLPPLLNGLPAADPEDVSQSEFAKLNQLDGEAFEDAFGRLSPAQRERYLQGG